MCTAFSQPPRLVCFSILFDFFLNGHYPKIFKICNFCCRNSALANGLAARGHNVTVISPDVDENPPNGVHYIHLEGIYTGERIALAKNLYKLSSTMYPWLEPINYNNHWYASCKGKRSAPKYHLEKFISFSTHFKICFVTFVRSYCRDKGLRDTFSISRQFSCRFGCV